MSIDVAIPGWVYKIALGITIASAVANVLPKSDLLNDYPRTKKVYETVIAFIAALALNLRYRIPGLNLSFLGFTKPPGIEPPPTVQELKKQAEADKK